MKFRPCIDLHNGQVKQIVGSTLSDDRPEALRTNFTAEFSPAYYAEMYRRDNLTGGHLIMLGPGCETAAREALASYPGGLQVGGGISAANASSWLDAGAAAVIVTSYVFRNGRVDMDRLAEMVRAVGRTRLVLDLSCRQRDGEYYVVTDRWQKFTEVAVNPESLDRLAGYCAEFLIHAADVEGKCAGIAEQLVADLGRWSPLPTTYAGGVSSMADVRRVRELGQGRLDITVGSSLDIFGGGGVTYAELVAFNRRQETPGS